VPLKAVGGIRRQDEKKRDVKGNKRNAISTYILLKKKETIKLYTR
jgi:hypothetical protein